MTGPDDDRLTCRRSGDDLLAQVAEGRAQERDAHQARCPHCQAALAEYQRLWEPMRALADEPVRAPDSVVDKALARIRAAVEHTDYGILESPDGVTRISARVVVVTARESARNIPGVRVALSRHITAPAGGPTTDPGVSDAVRDAAEVAAGVAGRSTAIEITLAADYGINLPELAARVRAEVARRVRQLTDLEPVQVTVIIDDVFD